MRISVALLISLLLFSCKKSADNLSTRLLKTESADNSGNVLHTEYGYDNEGRIITITQYKNNEESSIAVNISYKANVITLLSNPDSEPTYDETMEVDLYLDNDKRVIKRIEYMHGISKISAPQQSEIFRYDTLLCTYDPAGLLKNTTGSRYDSIYIDATHNSSTRFTSTASYTNDGGNIISSDEYVVYPVVIRADGTTTIAGGTSLYHNVFNYAKSFPNQADFKNAAVLNEYRLYYESPFNNSYKNMPDQIIRNSIDKDKNGAIIFSGSSTIDIERVYNAKGLLSVVNIISLNTPYKEIDYFYGDR